MRAMKKTRLSGVYTITCKVNGFQYVGSAADVRDRWGTHRGALRHQHHNNAALQADWNEHGEAAFEFKFIAEVRDPVMRRTIEQLYLTELLRAGHAYNRAPSAFSVAGLKWTDDQRLAFAEAVKGIPKSDEHRAALSAAAVRVWAKVPAEARRERMAAMGRGNLGKPKSEEHRRNIARGAGKITEDQVRELKRRLANGETQTALAQEFGITQSAISLIKRGKNWAHVTV